MAEIDAAAFTAQLNAELLALARRMFKMLTDYPPATFDQSEMGYRCYYCDAFLGAHVEGCEYAVLIADAGALKERKVEGYAPDKRLFM